MNLNNLPKIMVRSKKRVGRGLGSGKGKTAGRGQKGQKARGKVSADFSGAGLPLFKKLPLLRGWGNRSISAKPLPINLAKLVGFKSGEKVTLESLIEKGVITSKDAQKSGVKILGNGEVSTKLVVSAVLVSKSAAAKIVKAGGQVE